MVSENFVIFAKKCPSKSSLKEVTLCRVSISTEQSTPPTMISYKFTKYSM